MRKNQTGAEENARKKTNEGGATHNSRCKGRDELACVYRRRYKFIYLFGVQLQRLGCLIIHRIFQSARVETMEKAGSTAPRNHAQLAASPFTPLPTIFGPTLCFVGLGPIDQAAAKSSENTHSSG